MKMDVVVEGRPEAVRECGDSFGPKPKKPPQTLRHGDHPLPHGDRWNDVIDQVRGVCAMRLPLHDGQTPRPLHGFLQSPSDVPRENRDRRSRTVPGQTQS